ncbi:Transcription factor bHLH113 [Platanthera zijinensis]|uniref:Transcription factor bHLH113 n=1 Tax=Platanthera zijinensis TaxID=2320716 RepID=A0AAP0BJJ7_9ASPA
MEREEEEEVGLVELFLSSPSPLLCFGDGAEDAAQRSSDSSLSTLSSSPSSKSTASFSKKEQDETNGRVRPGGGCKMTKKDVAGSKATIKARKERLGEKIATLQQLVSPFGKSDTASVLHEALAYIRFLHEQIQVLCTPYLLQSLPCSASLQVKEEGLKNRKNMVSEDLHSLGLCLVPLSCTIHVANHINGADLWAPSNPNFIVSSHNTSPLQPTS